MPLKCACGCGQDIPDGASYVGVPLNDGTGNMIAFIPEHHQGPKVDYSRAVTPQEPVYADNPKIRGHRDTLEMRDVKRINEQKGRHFFEPGAMRFFRSKIATRTAYLVGRTAYFITSEQFKPMEGVPHARKYSVRAMDLDTGNVNTIGDFNVLPSLAEAQRALNAHLATHKNPCGRRYRRNVEFEAGAKGMGVKFKASEREQKFWRKSSQQDIKAAGRSVRRLKKNPIGYESIVREIIEDMADAKRAHNAGNSTNEVARRHRALGLYDALTAREQIKFANEHPTVDEDLFAGYITGQYRDVRYGSNPSYKELYQAGKRVERRTGIPMSGASIIGHVAGKKAERQVVGAALGAVGENPIFNAKQKALFNHEEDRFWTNSFIYWKDEGKTDTQADKLAWRDVCQEFPRLKRYMGALPGVAKNPEAWASLAGISTAIKDGFKNSHDHWLRQGRWKKTGRDTWTFYGWSGEIELIKHVAPVYQKNLDDGTINTHNARVTEIRYLERGTSTPYKHKLEVPVTMKKVGSKIVIPPLSVKPEGIVQ